MEPANNCFVQNFGTEQNLEEKKKLNLIIFILNKNSKLSGRSSKLIYLKFKRVIYDLAVCK